jgi:hypothetical protein
VGVEPVTWAAVVRDAEQRHHVTNTGRASTLGRSRSGFFAAARRDGWSAPFPGVRVAPGKDRDLRTILVAVTDAARHPAAAAGRTAAWLHGLERRPPRRLEVVVPHGGRPPTHDRVVIRRARWLVGRDVVELDGIPTLTGAALAMSGHSLDDRELRALLIHGAHAGILDLDDAAERLSTLGPIGGSRRLRELVADLASRRLESIFEDDVRTDLDLRGYQPSPSPLRIETPDGRGVTADIALPWCVAVETEGDAHHRSRDQRRNDRRRLAQYAGTPWVPVPVDWRDWQLEPHRVRSALDAAILRQRAAGIGRDTVLPPHLRG